MQTLYSDNKNQQILLGLLKCHGVRRAIVSPGATNPAMVMSLQTDPFFEVYSCVDERSAAYMACGLSEETNEPVLICCTGATSSRNYMSALTEAYYRKLPIVVVTCSKPNYFLGHLFPQVTNRNVYPADILIDGEHLQVVKDDKDYWDCQFKINKGLLEMTHHGGGPVHFNVECIAQTCTTKQLPDVRPIYRITQNDNFPELSSGKIAVFIGSHKLMTKELENSIDKFCERHNAVVFCDHTSGYHGKFDICPSLMASQLKHKFYNIFHVDLIIHLGEPSGDYNTTAALKSNKVWRLSEDGCPRISFGVLDYVFEMPDCLFFEHYCEENKQKNFFYDECTSIYRKLYDAIPELPLSHIYVAKELSNKLPENSEIHIAIITALRAWNFFKLSPSIRTNCNVGGFGIDGCMSSMIGASLADKSKIYYCFMGDLAFFYDMNSIGNRHLGSNVRILLLNDGKGSEFTHFQFPKYSNGDRDHFVAAEGHFGHQSNVFVKHIAEDLGFEYFQINNKEDFFKYINRFTTPEITSKPMLMELLSSSQEQSDAWEILANIADVNTDFAVDLAKRGANKILNLLKGK